MAITDIGSYVITGNEFSIATSGRDAQKLALRDRMIGVTSCLANRSHLH